MAICLQFCMYLNRFVDIYIQFQAILLHDRNRKISPHAHTFYPQKNPHPVDKDVDNSVSYV